MKRSDLLRSHDTIAAEATPHGKGGMSVIRLSGPDSDRITAELFDRKLPKPGEHRYGKLLSRPGDLTSIIDEILLNRFKAPNSYTGEDLFEISTHGSPLIVAETLDALYKQGARPAGAGEFTLRAFLNGKIDLSQAEAVADLIEASSKEAVKQALRQLQGGIGDAVGRVGESVMKLLMQCELELDFVEDDIELIAKAQKIRIIDEALNEIENMLNGYTRSRLLREGVRVAIIGAPNVGKSSIFNKLIKKSAAIVHPEPGTTRDVLHDECEIDGIRFEIFDTAGIRATSDEIEDEGVRRAVEAGRNADLVVAVASVDINESPECMYSDFNKAIYVMNKSDLGVEKLPDKYLSVSALSGDGIERLRSRMLESVIDSGLVGNSTISRERHHHNIQDANTALKRTKIALETDLSAEMIAEDLRDASAALDRLTGQNTVETVLDKIFMEFCIGK